MLPHPFCNRRWADALAYCALLFFLFLSTTASAQDRPPYFDGPYISQENDSLRIRWVERGYANDTLIARKDATVFQRDSLPFVNLQSLDFPTAPTSTYSGVEKVVVISDVHGQFDLMRELLLAGGVMDEDHNWTLGQGHLVVNGDNMGRGDQVLPILWLFFQLEQQALAQGGRVHMIVGNHELMALNGDLRYIHRKYNFTAGVLQTPYPQLFQKGSVLGDWLAQHQVAISINGYLFVHAGISPKLLGLKMSFEEINTLFRERIMRQPQETINADPLLTLMEGEDGPVWYRGYFEDKPLSQGKFRKQLKQYGQQKMVVGHTSYDEITAFYEGQLINVDCSIKLGQDGEMLLIENNAVYTIDRDGEHIPLVVVEEEPTISIQEVLMASTSRPEMTLTTDFPRLIRFKMDKEYQDAEIALRCDDMDLQFSGRVRVRGNMRRQVCNIPPVMVDLRKSDLDELDYVRNDKLKLVIPCRTREVSQTNLYKEFLVYELYREINDHALATKLVDVVIDGPKRQEKMTGFLIETEKDYAHRTGAMVLQVGRASASKVDRQRFVRMMFFQYMISNSDWSIHNKHNLELAKYPDNPLTEFIAYDFDYAGFVGNPYAVPADVLPITSIHERYFFSYKTTDEEIDDAIEYFLAKEEAIYAICANADYLDAKTRENCQEYLRPFFDLLREPQKFKRTIRR